MRAILISVDYSDILCLTLPRNRHHFEDVMVVTAPGDSAVKVAENNNCRVFTTDAFYRNGGAFRKWLAMEEGLEAFGRHGWMCVMDADVVWPQQVELPTQIGNIYGPAGRRMSEHFVEESEWKELRRHRTSGREVAGYTQIFHADDPVLKETPWYETDWMHAGGGDSFFARKWKTDNQVYLPWEVLHIGESGQNWMGRCTPYQDGSQHPESEQRKIAMAEMYRKRRVLPRRKRTYQNERINEDA